MISRAAERAALGDAVAWTMVDGATMAGTVVFVGYETLDVRRVDGTICRVGLDLTIWKATPDNVLDASEFFQHLGEAIPVGSQRILNTPQTDDDENGAERVTPAGYAVELLRVDSENVLAIGCPGTGGAWIFTRAEWFRLSDPVPVQTVAPLPIPVAKPFPLPLADDERRRCWMAPNLKNGEYVVRCFLLLACGELVRHEDGDYFTTDQDDAGDTFNAMMRAEAQRLAPAIAEVW